MKRVRALIIDDSPTSRAALRAALAGDPVLEVVGEASDGPTAHRHIARLAPDLITMDVFLRAESGIELAASIMQDTPTPIVMVTAADVRDPSLAFRALQAGALDVCAKPPGPAHPDYAKRRALLLRVLKTLAAVPVVHRARAKTRSAHQLPRVAPEQPRVTHGHRTVGGGRGPGPMLLMGASTGGPPILSKLLRALPAPFPLPIAIVQHITADFVPGFAKWLSDDTGHPVAVVSGSLAAESGVVYLPVADQHLVLEPHGRLCASNAPARGHYRPSIDVLFESATAVGVAAGSIAVLLTGMGADGAEGLLQLRNAGARTFVQAPETCAVASMPARAIALRAAEHVIQADALAAAISAAALHAAAARSTQ